MVHTEQEIIAIHGLEAELGDCAERWTIATFGPVYRSNGPTFGPTGSIGGLTSPQALNHVKQLLAKHKYGCSMQLTRKSDGKHIGVWIEDTRDTPDRFQLRFHVRVTEE